MIVIRMVVLLLLVFSSVSSADDIVIALGNAPGQQGRSVARVSSDSGGSIVWDTPIPNTSRLWGIWVDDGGIVHVSQEIEWGMPLWTHWTLDVVDGTLLGSFTETSGAVPMKVRHAVGGWMISESILILGSANATPPTWYSSAPVAINRSDGRIINHPGIFGIGFGIHQGWRWSNHFGGIVALSSGDPGSVHPKIRNAPGERWKLWLMYWPTGEISAFDFPVFPVPPPGGCGFEETFRFVQEMPGPISSAPCLWLYGSAECAVKGYACVEGETPDNWSWSLMSLRFPDPNNPGFSLAVLPFDIEVSDNVAYYIGGGQAGVAVAQYAPEDDPFDPGWGHLVPDVSTGGHVIHVTDAVVHFPYQTESPQFLPRLRGISRADGSLVYDVALSHRWGDMASVP